MLGSGNLDFSFSGLKTAVRYLLPRLDPIPLADLCASFQEAVVDVLVKKTMGAVIAAGVRVLAVSGGVSCNSRLRERFSEECARLGVELMLAPPELCTDNAGMIAYAAALKWANDPRSELDAEIHPNLRMFSSEDR
jgi:N6-L-threonylcarbamoyladenine synthase